MKPAIVFIDDEVNVLRALKRTVRSEAYTVLTTHSIEELFHFIQTTPCAVVVSDQRMPEMEGTDVLEQVQCLSPDTFRILLTGYAEGQVTLSAMDRGIVCQYLTKPWDEKALRKTLKQAVFKYEQIQENKRSQRLTDPKNLIRLAFELPPKH